MTTEMKLRTFIVERYGNVSEFTKSIDMANSTFSTIMKNGLGKANISNVIKICKALDISADELAEGRIVPIKKETTLFDLCESVSFVRMSNSADLILDGQPLTDEEKESLTDIVEFAIEYLRRRRK